MIWFFYKLINFSTSGSFSIQTGWSKPLESQQLCYDDLANSLDNQSKPSYKPLPWTAQVAWMYHWKKRIQLKT